ncbi:LOW QUALITY PROTEIN: deoxynucleotidyltransferase terminal-interacting protein 2 [Centrocercus urophasianus]|uniref:LOW QUALITY PROTEIN: deoxynucleotidyltransferase terminal-interacting protein 2 n=1 Tax=Centrocercus urophasianus TaxID=9002 RepID=UPI001C646C17|nr:LOW QUALITY PROTEIN: deoxynucleotidyltransferase terminal-interacting protein 2 [Centrocercus urophasianus]
MGWECGEARDARSAESCVATGGDSSSGHSRSFLCRLRLRAVFPLRGRNSIAARRAPGAPPRGAPPEGRAEEAGGGAVRTMVATRRATRRREAGTAAAGGDGPGGATETVSAEIGTSVSTRMSRRSKAVCKPAVIRESQLEEVDHAGTKPDVSDSTEMQISRNENTAVHSARSSADPQADGDVSEAESNCSAVSGLQTPLFIRVTRRRQIVVPYQPASPSKKRHNRTAFLNELSRTVDEDDVSEAESCSSAVSDVRMPNSTKTTRNKQSRKKLQSDLVCEAQSENISDAESCCFHQEPSITAKRTTRSMQMKLQAENTQHAENVNKIISKPENVIEDTIKSESDLISDSSPAAEFNIEVASFVTECNKESGSPKSECSPKPANVIPNEGVKQNFLNDMAPSSPEKMGKKSTESPVKKALTDTLVVEVDDSEEENGQMQEEHSKVPGKVTLKIMDVRLTDCMSPKVFLESPGEIIPNENEAVAGNRRVDAEAAVERTSTHACELRKGEQSRGASSPGKDVSVAHMTDSIISSCRMVGISVDGSEDQTRESAEFVSRSSERSSDENDSFALLLSKDGSSESENCDATEENLSDTEAEERTPSVNKSLEKNSLHVEGLFVIDTEPGMGSSRKYYLDQVEQGSDVESKHEGSEKVEESSDLEEAEEELIDEDEKDEDDDLLKNKIDVLHLSSSIDPGLNIRKLGGLYISFDGKKQKPSTSVIKQLKEKKKDQLLQKSIITPDFERKECVPPLRESLQQLKKQRRAEREKTTGDGWFGMKAPEITSELKNDLKVLKMRAALDPKHFYKKNDRDGLPKYFQVGTVLDSPIDFYHSRIPKKQRKKTIVEELLADSEFRRYNKRKYQEIMSEKAAYAAGKKNRKKKKFHN